MADEIKIKIIAENRKARHDYQISDKIEAGVVLTGTEVKSLREGKANLADSYAIVKSHELWLLNVHIPHYGMGNRSNVETMRTRKLLVHREELRKFAREIEGTGMSLIPLQMYFKDGLVKIELGLGKGKKAHDKRRSIKERESKRQLEQLKKHGR